ncbi:SPOR domain-containing protein [Kocuria palustris]|uniref:SPOR domain-containing protein n=1 Tax=Kocuria palustris TaxID=71999 RepID=UPI0028CB99FB|nr:SPOR domain-containing protein [Kocuria palustris]
MEYWYNLRTGQVEQGQQSDYSQLIGPYASEAEAQKALETAAAKSKAWDDREREFRDD